MDANLTKKIRSKLQAELKSLRLLLDKIEASKDEKGQGFVPPPTHGQDDEAERVVDLELGIQTKGNLKERLKKIEIALQKIDQGTYGICEACGDQIGEKRLDYFPEVSNCIECQRKMEQK